VENLMLDLRTLLVPTDFSDHARVALGTALGLAKAADARIHLAHAVPLPARIPGFGEGHEDHHSELRDLAGARLRENAKEVSDAGGQVDTHLGEGTSSEVIVELANGLGADLIVMGTRGLSGLKHVMLGSVAERTICHAPCPVMTVRSDEEVTPALLREPLAIRNILVPTDFSEHAERAVRYAIGLAQLFEARIQLLRAYDAQILAMTPGAIATPAEFWKELHDAAQLGLEHAQIPIVEAGVESELYVEHKDPTAAIVETAEALQSDLIVMGTRGLSGLRRALLGSTTARTLRVAPCPVVTVSAEEA
jgi:nucleotide-binding universal stress UspA family protein